MYLGPTDEDRLRVFQAAELARRVQGRGLKLSAPEAVALVCDEMHLAARAGGTFEEVLEAGRRAVGPDQVMDGVAEIVPEIRLEVLLDEGTTLVVLHEPWGPGEVGVRGPRDEFELAAGRERRRLIVRNGSERPVRVSSHYPFSRANRRLEFDRDAARGFRLDVPAGSSIRWAAGQTREVDLVRYAGPAGEGSG
jgi:urease subunit gamma/beta